MNITGTVSDRSSFMTALHSWRLLKIKEAREWLLKIIRLTRNPDEDKIIALNRLQQELLSTLLNYRLDLPEGELLEEDKTFVNDEIERLREILDKPPQ